MDTDTKARLDRVRDAARTLLAERDWFRHQADTIDAALKALGVDVPNANAHPPRTRPPALRAKEAGKRLAYQSATEYRSNLDIVADVLDDEGAMDIRQLRVALLKRGRDMTYAAVASLCSKGTTSGRLRRIGVGMYRAACPEHELTSHLGEMATNEMDHPREADALMETVPAHLLNEQPAREPMNYVTFDPETGAREYATEYHEDDEHEGEGK